MTTDVLHNLGNPGQNENAGPLVQKLEKSVIKGTKVLKKKKKVTEV